MVCVCGGVLWVLKLLHASLGRHEAWLYSCACHHRAFCELNNSAKEAAECHLRGCRARRIRNRRRRGAVQPDHRAATGATWVAL